MVTNKSNVGRLMEVNGGEVERWGGSRWRGVVLVGEREILGERKIWRDREREKKVATSDL